MIVADWAASGTIKQSAAKSDGTLQLSSFKCEYYGAPTMLSPSRRGLKRRVRHAYNAVPIAEAPATYNAVPIAKGTETSPWPISAAPPAPLQCCPHSEGD